MTEDLRIQVARIISGAPYPSGRSVKKAEEIIPAIRAAIADEILNEANALRAEAERLGDGNRLDQLEAIGVSAKAGHLEHAARIARGDQ